MNTRLPRLGNTGNLIPWSKHLIDVLQDTFNVVSQAQGPVGPQGPAGPQGPIGATGTRGSLWYTGTGAPGTITGVLTGDMYLDDATGDVYQY